MYAFTISFFYENLMYLVEVFISQRLKVFSVLVVQLNRRKFYKGMSTTDPAPIRRNVPLLWD